MLILKNVNKFYHTSNQRIHALKDVSLEIDNKGFVVILGRSGCGKSTLLNIIGGLDDFDSGDIIINGTNLSKLKKSDWNKYRNNYVGFVFQEFYLIEEYTVGKNIALALELQGYSQDIINKKVNDILKQIDLYDYKDKLPNQLSGGEKQRIALARALVKDPKIILADEPTGNLDEENGILILDILKKLSQSKLVILVTHDREYANKYGDRIIELKDGKVINDYMLVNTDKNHTTINEDFHIFKIKMPFLYTFNLAIKNIFIKKYRLILILFLFTCSLIFLGISSTLLFYDSQKAAALTLNKGKINYLEIEKWESRECNNGDCDYVLQSFTEYDITQLKSKFKNMKFITSYDTDASIFDFEEIRKIDDYDNLYDFKRITILEENNTYELSYGNYPNDNEILITDFIAELIIYYDMLSEINSIEQLIDKNLTYKNNGFKISGIVKTDYKKYHTQKVNELKNAGGYVHYDLFQKYLSLFMTRKTYENYFTDNSDKEIHVSVFLSKNINENYRFLKYLHDNTYTYLTKYSAKLNSTKHFFNQLSTILIIISAIFLGLTFFLIYTYFLMIYNKMQKSIGILRALGASGIDIGKIFIIESILITIFVSSIAIIATSYLTNLLDYHLVKDFKLDIILLYFNYINILFIFIIALLFILISTLVPIKRIIKTKPINAIKGF